MPSLPIFTAQRGQLPVSGGRRASVPDNAGVELGRSVQKTADFLLTDMEDKESRQALIQSSEIRAKYARELDAAQLTGADTDKLRENLQDDLSKVGDTFQTKKGAQSLQLHASNTELMFDEQSNRIRVQRAAATARLEGQKFLNTAGELMRANPMYLGVAEKDADAFVATLSNVSPEQRAEIAQGLKKELNMAAAVSSARIDPEGTKKALEEGKWDLTPQQRETAVQRADTEIRGKRANDEYIRAQAARVREEEDGKARDEHFASIRNGEPVERAIMDDPRLTPETREHLIRLVDAKTKETVNGEKVSNPTVRRDLWLRIHAPDTDPRKIFNGDPIFQAVEKGLLNTTDANTLNGQVAAMKDEGGRAFGVRLQGRLNTVAAAMRVSPEYSAQPELAAAIQLEMVSQVEKRASELRKENKDPSVLLDPESKDYYFKPGLIKSVAEDVKQRARAAMPQAPVVNTQAEYDALPPGPYIDSRGNPGIKPERRKAAKGETPDYGAAAERRRAVRGSQEELFTTPPPLKPVL